MALTLLTGPVARAGDTGNLAGTLASPDRPEADRARDAGRRPADVVAFLGIEPGMTAIDLIAAGGYYTEVLSLAVGPKGKVYAQNPSFVLNYREGTMVKPLTDRLSGGRLSNVERLDRDLADLKLVPGSIDVAITALNFHDLYNGRGPEVAEAFLATVYRLLAPGGVLGLIDHAGNPGADNEELHRIEESRVDAAVKASDFEIEAKSDLLRNPEDDHSKNVFDPAVRGRTDRFLLRLRKPR
jgi:predicted methyltransferase